MESAPLSKIPTKIHFVDNDTVFGRTDWSKNATAFAFRSSPPEGHYAAKLASKIPDWRENTGHAHPDANSFIIFANGKYLTGDSGYAGVPLTIHHNTLLFDGKGQAKEGDGHDAFSAVPYQRLNNIRISSVEMNDKKVSILADVTAAYEPEVGVRKFIRRFDFSAPGEFTILDEVKTKNPQTVTAYLHADNKIVDSSNGNFIFEPDGKPSLLAQIIDPTLFTTQIEENFLTAPGRPGSVDKGEREQRGVRLVISTKSKVSKAKFSLRLRIQNN